MGSTASFKEESNLVSDLADTEQKALAQLKDLVAAALASGEFDLPPATDVAKAEEPAKPDAAAVGEDPKIEAAAEGETKTDALAQEEPKAEVAIEEAKPTEPAPEDKTVVVPEEEGTKTVVPTAEETVLPASVDTAVSAATEPKVEELIWGVPLAGDDERTDTVLLKFLRAREFKVKQAMAMLKAAVLWRKSFGIDALLDTDLEVPELESVVFYRGADREGHPVCYNVYSEFLDKELYDKTFGDDDKRDRFLRWRIQLLERGIREQLDFSSSGVCSMVQVTDLKNAPPMLGKHRAVTRQALTLLQDNYPEFIAKKVFINVPWWYIAANKMMSPFLTQRTMSKFTFCSPAKSAETLFRYIAPEQVPVQFGGLFKEDDTEFSTSDIVTELTVKPSSKETIEIRDSEMTSETHHLPLQLLKDITNNFSEENILGRGGFGVVYKGVLPNGSMVAVKKVVSMMSSKEQCEISQKQFENEVNILMGLKHPNIVELVGYCYEMKHLRIPHEGKYIFSWKIDSLLCLEYLPNGSLDKYISDATSGLDWHTRYKIVKGISYGLQYLHEQSDDPIIHLDLKPTNILLNADMIPKIADFGISRQFHQRKTIHTRISSGTFGYMPPEFTRGIITPMSDIFSLGVIIMEVIMGHKDYPYNIEASSKDFTNTELLKWRNMMEKEPVYTNLETDFQQIQNCIQIGLMCLNPDRTKRPTIRNVINMLQGLESLT